MRRPGVVVVVVVVVVEIGVAAAGANERQAEYLQNSATSGRNGCRAGHAGIETETDR